MSTGLGSLCATVTHSLYEPGEVVNPEHVGEDCPLVRGKEDSNGSNDSNHSNGKGVLMSLSSDYSPSHQRYLLALLILGLLASGIGILAGGREPHLQTYDAGNYIEVARNILAGRGFSSQVVSNFYQRYPQVQHPEDRRASSWSLVLAGSLWLWGESAFAAQLPNLLLGLLIVPLLVYLLGRAWRLTPVAAFGGAVLLMGWPHWLQASFTAQADVLFSCLTILILLAIARSHQSPTRPDFGNGAHIAWILVAGALVGLAYTVKPAALLLMPPVAVCYWLRLRSVPARLRIRWLGTGLVAAILVAAPMLVRNYLTFGNPVYSTNLHTAGHIGFDDTGQALMRVYWDEQLPSLAGAIRTYGVSGLAVKAGRQLVAAGGSIFGGVGIFFIVPAVLLLTQRRGYPWLRTGWLALGAWVIELAVVWAIWPRLLLPFMPVVTLTAAAGGLGLAQRFVRRRHTVILLMSVVGLVTATGVGGYCWWSHRQQPEVAISKAYAQAATWIRDNLPANTTIMSHRPYLIRFHSDHRVVQIPFDRRKKIEEVIDHYRVGALIVQQLRPTQRWAQQLPRGEIIRIAHRRGWPVVYEGGEVRVYAEIEHHYREETF